MLDSIESEEDDEPDAADDGLPITPYAGQSSHNMEMGHISKAVQSFATRRVVNTGQRIMIKDNDIDI